LVIPFYLVELFGNGKFNLGGFIADIRLGTDVSFLQVLGKPGQKQMYTCSYHIATYFEYLFAFFCPLASVGVSQHAPSLGLKVEIMNVK
jgi:hypothetical protein